MTAGKVGEVIWHHSHMLRHVKIALQGTVMDIKPASIQRTERIETTKELLVWCICYNYMIHYVLLFKNMTSCGVFSNFPVFFDCRKKLKYAVECQRVVMQSHKSVTYELSYQ